MYVHVKTIRESVLKYGEQKKAQDKIKAKIINVQYMKLVIM